MIETMKFIDLTNQKFNKLTVISRIPNTSPIKWLCQCDCGKMVEVRGVYLRNNHTKSCGCQRIESGHKTGIQNRKDLSNQKFGFLTVIKDSGKRKNHQIVWLCECECGNKTEVITTNLVNGSTKSCGCIKRSYGEAKIEKILKENNISYITELNISELNNARFDFAIFKNNQIIRLIEFDGEHHYKEVSFHKNNKYTLQDRQKQDKIKNEYALSHNIPLVRIPYWERDNITIEMINGDKYLVR